MSHGPILTAIVGDSFNDFEFTWPYAPIAPILASFKKDSLPS